MSKIELKQLSFAYDNQEALLFDQANITMDTNWKLGLIRRNWPWENNLIKIVTKAVGLPRRDSSSSRFRLFSTNSCRRTTAHLLCLTRGDFF